VQSSYEWGNDTSGFIKSWENDMGAFHGNLPHAVNIDNRLTANRQVTRRGLFLYHPETM
jgi:hypothetical protein